MYRTTLATSLLAAALVAGNAVPAQAAGLGTAAHAAGGTSAAKADAYPVADALAEISDVTNTSESAALAEGFTSVISFGPGANQGFRVTTTGDRAGNQRTAASGGQGASSFETLTFAGVGTWIGLKGDLVDSFFGRSALRLALKYIGRSDANYIFVADPNTPKATPEFTGFAPTVDLTPKTVASADKAAFGDSDGVRYRLVTKATRKEPASRFSIDVLGGRIVSQSVDAGGLALTGTWGYGADDLTAPSEAESVGLDVLSPALEAASLPKTLKSQARRILKKAKTSAQKQHRTVSAARIRHYTVAIVKKDNGDSREIRTRAKKIKNGARIFARNPYTNEVVAYKIIVVGGKAQFSRD